MNVFINKMTSPQEKSHCVFWFIDVTIHLWAVRHSVRNLNF